MIARATPPVTPGAGSDTASFEPFSTGHVLTVALLLAWIGAGLLLGRRLGPGTGERRLRRAWGWSIVAFQVVQISFWLWPSNFDLQASLPLHVCDLVAWPCALSMFLAARWPRSLVYFFGLGLSTQGFITPTLEEGPRDIRFWLFWIGHAQIIGTGVYLVVVSGYRPGARDCGFAIGVGVAYTVLMATFDSIVRVNYGYVGPMTPTNPTIIDRLGPWPGRVLKVMAAAAMLFVVMWLVWPACARARAALSRHASTGV